MKKKRLMLRIVIIRTLVFIFGQSLLDQETSVRESNAVKEKIVQPIHKAVTGKDVLSYDIRDIAHMAEFSVFGLELTLLLGCEGILKWSSRAVSCCGVVALIDESIQWFSGRTPQVIDIWFDIIGSVIGVILIQIIISICKYVKQRNTQ